MIMHTDRKAKPNFLYTYTCTHIIKQKMYLDVLQRVQLLLKQPQPLLRAGGRGRGGRREAWDKGKGQGIHRISFSKIADERSVRLKNSCTMSS